MKRIVLFLALLIAAPAFAQVPADLSSGIALKDEGTVQGRINQLDCIGSAIACTSSGLTGTLTITLPTASDTVAGIVELATVAETTTGTDTGRAVTPAGLAGSAFGKPIKSVQVPVTDFTTSVTTGDVFYFRVPQSLNGMNLIGAQASVVRAGQTNDTTVALTRCAAAATGDVCSGTTAAMLSGDITINTGENDSATGSNGSIDTSNDDVATGQIIKVTVPTVSTTAPKGLIVNLDFQLP